MKPLIPAILSAFVALSAHAAEPIVIANFEGDTYGDWKPNGDAFGAGPAHGGLINPWRSDLTKPVTGFMGKGFASSYYLGDGGTGSLTSPEFKIERKYITFLIGGSQDVERVCLNLLVGGKVVRVAGASKDLPEGTETLAPGSWDVEEFAGKSAIIQIGWLQVETRGMPFNQAMSLPNQLTLRSTPEGPRLAWTPVNELKSLRAKSIDCGALDLAPDAPNPLGKASGELLELRAIFTPPAKGEEKFTLRGIPIIYNTEQQITPNPTSLGAEVAVTGGNVIFQKLEVHELKSIWVKP